MPVFLVMLSPSTSRAQAWVPEEGQASIFAVYAYGEAEYTLFSGDFIQSGVNYGKKKDGSGVQSHSAYVGLDYGISSKVALSANIPDIVSRYTGSAPHSPKLPDGSTLDDGVYHGGFQDFRFGVRYMAIVNPLVVTPFIAVVIPSHDYPSTGHSVIGKDFKELHIGLYLGKLLTFVSNNLYAQAGYDFAYVEEVDDMRVNRSDVDLTLGYFVTPSITVSGTMAYLKSHGGIDFLETYPGAAEFHKHDRHAKANYLNLGGSVSVEVNDALNFFVSYTGMVSGENTHALRSVAVGSTWTMQILE